MNYTYAEGGIESAFKVAFNAEFLLMQEYAELMKLAKAQDVILEEFLYFFIKEQRKSVGEYGDFLARLELCKNEASALLIFDNELKK
jgi:ferritin